VPVVVAVTRLAAADRVAAADGLAERTAGPVPDARTVAGAEPACVELAWVELAWVELAWVELAWVELAWAEATPDVAGAGLVFGVAGGELAAAVVGGWVWSPVVAGLNVATDSIAPATRQTARMLASTGISVPRPATGPVSPRSRLRRRCARSSRWYASTSRSSSRASSGIWMSSGGSSHPAPPPGFTATSGVNRTRCLQYGPTLTVREPGAVITRGLVAGHSRPSALGAVEPDTTYQTTRPRPLSGLLCAKPAGGYGVLRRRRAGGGAPGIAARRRARLPVAGQA